MPEDSQSAVGEVSHAQHAFWLAQHLDPNSVVFNVFVSTYFPLPFDPRVAGAALSEIGRGHAAMRTRLVTVAGAPVRHVEEDLPIPLVVVDASEWSLPEVHREAQRAAREPFDLAAGPALRARFFVRPQGFILTLVGHHAALDFQSVALINYQFLDRYREGLDGTVPLTPSRIPTSSDDSVYCDYERRLLAGPRAARILEYWREQLRDPASRLVLPSDRSGGGRVRAASGLYRIELGGAVLDSLHELVDAQASTMYVTLLAAVSAWLYRIGGQEDFYLGTTFSLRRKSVFEGILGPLINTVPLRLRVVPGTSFTDWHQQVKDVFRAGWRGGAAPFGWVVDNLPHDIWPRGLAPTVPGLTPVVFNFASLPGASAPARSLDWGQCGAATEMMITIYVLHGRLSININYDPRLFDRATVGSLTDSLVALLGHLHEDPDRALEDLALVSDTGRALSADRLVGPRIEPVAPTFPRTFARRCRREPDRIAVSDSAGSLSYGELNARANAAAAALIGAGAGPEDVSGVLAPRGFAALAILIAIQKAGGAFLFLDVDQPPERWRLLLDRARAARVLVAHELRDALPPVDIPVLVIEQLLDAPAAGDPEDPGDPARLAYVMFTSGSSGAPKAVGVEQGGMANHHDAKIRQLGLGRDDVVLQSASASFVISIWQLLAPLMAGARVHVVDAATAAEPARLFAGIARAGVTIVQAVPSLLRVWLEQPAAEVLGTLRAMICTGEALPVTLVRRWLARFPAVALLNAFGMTECSDDVAHVWLRAPPGSDVTRIGVGAPIANVEITVRDDVLHRLPPAIPGEICIAGACLARGYLDGESDARFAVDPTGGVRLYRTGDRGRLRPDATLDFLGRIDSQIKLRGQRIELGEIEAALADVPGVHAAAACLASAGEPTARIIGYVVPDDPGLIRDVAVALQARLPAAMRPAQLVGLHALPLNTNGKLDRGRLSQPVAAPAQPADKPRTDRERALAALWRDLLGVAEVDIRDDFFALGGHSLLLMEMSARLADVVGATLPVAELFSVPTIAALAARLDGAVPEKTGVLAAPPVTGSAPATAAQERFWIVEQLQPQSPHLNLAACIRLRGPVDVDALAAAFGDLVERHEALRTRFVVVDGRPYQRVEPPALRLDVTDFSDRSAEDARQLCISDAGIGFDVSVAPLLRPRLVRLGPTDHLLSVVTHHLVCDGWSVGVLIEDGLDLYEARVRGVPAHLQPVGMQLGEYSRREQSRSDGDLRADLDYWRRRLDGARSLDLPRARPVRAGLAQRMQSVGRTVAGVSVGGLRSLARSEATSLFRVVLGALQALLARACGQLDVSVAVPAAQRGVPELQRTVGCLINSLIIRCDLAGDPAFRDLLAQVHRRASEATRHQTLPFERLVRALQGADGAVSPMQTYLTYNQPGPARWVRGSLVLEMLDLPPPSPFVDLSFYADEHPDRIELRATYDASRFDSEQVEQMLTHWQAILVCVSSDPERRLADLPLTKPPWRRCGAVGRQRGRAPPAETSWTDDAMGDSVSARFESIAARHADEPAVVTPSGRWTYAQLQQRAASITQNLSEHRSEPGRVALLFENDDLMLPPAILGVLAAGDAFVSLDATHPDTRLREVIANAEPHALVHGSDLAARAAGLVPPDALLVADAEPGAVARQLTPPTVESCAYIMYTSGSTGRPKGVIQSHRNLIHFARAYAAVLGGVGPGDRVSLLANAAHDAGLMDFFVALLHGATLYPMDVRRRGLGESIRWIERSKISVVHTTPTFFRAWTAALAGRAPAPLRAVVFDGEPSLRRDVEVFRERFAADGRLVNCYGSTESSISMHATVSQDVALPERAAFCLEGPVDRTEVSLGTPAGEQASLYGIGEIYLHSPYVTPGYWRDPALTDAVFADDETGRIYRTGDLGRLLPGGWLEVVGRKDRQIKILGQRVELPEVEARLCEVSGAADACVLYRELRPGRHRLEAYLSAPAAPADPGSILDALRATLPEYMVPQRCTILARIPRTPNTKVDLRALLATTGAEEGSPAQAATATAIEGEIASLVGALLDIDPVPVDRSFFELGGDSLQLLELHHRLQQRYVDLRAAELFRFPTVRGLAARLSGKHGGVDVGAATDRGARRRVVRERIKAGRG